MIAELLPAEVFLLLLVFVRVGAALMLLPGLGEAFVAPRLRLLLALFLALLLTPVVTPALPAMPQAPSALVAMLMGEALVGIFLGTLGRLFMAALATAGMVIASMSSFANALVMDPAAAQQGSIMGSFLTVAALLLIFALDLHHMLLMAVVDSYAIFVPGQLPPAGDLSDTIARTVAKSFLVAVQMAAPFIGVAAIFYLGLGLLARLMPQVQIFFIAIPLQIALALGVMFLSLPVVLYWFLSELEAAYLPFILSR